MKTHLSKSLAAILIFSMMACSAGATDWYVDDNGLDAPGRGLSPSTPFRTISYALEYYFESEDVIWIYPGTYNEDVSWSGTGEEEVYLFLRSTFDGTNHWVIDQTVIQGSVSVEFAANFGLYGLTIENEGLDVLVFSGLLGDPCSSEVNLNFCVFKGYVDVRNSDCWVNNCRFSDASDTPLQVRNPDRGASDVQCTNCLFSNNWGMYEAYLDNVNEHFESCSFLGRADDSGYNHSGRGGVIYITGDGEVWEDSFVNCIFAPGISNPLVDANRDIYTSNCCIAQPDFDLYSNQYVFADALSYIPNANGYIPWINSTYHMQQGSPCINATGLGGSGGLDVYGNARVQQVIMDIGAEETSYESNAIWYVNGAVGSSGTGRSWQSPFKTINEALTRAGNVDTIFIAPGTYQESLLIQHKTVNLVGKYINSEECPATDIFLTGNGQNYVIKLLDTSSTIKNLTIGYPAGMYPGWRRGVWFDNTGYYNEPVKIIGCILQNLQHMNSGCAIYAVNARLDVVNTLIRDNSTNGYCAGGILSYGSTAYTSYLNVVNCTIVGNTSSLVGQPNHGNGVTGWGSTTICLYNSILWDNYYLTNPQQVSDYYGVADKRNCRTQQDGNQAPVFRMDGSYELKNTGSNLSYYIDRGEDSLYSSSSYGSVDLAGKERVYDFIRAVSQNIDIGAYEYNPRPRIYVDILASSTQYDGSSWVYPIKYLQDALDTVRDSNDIEEIWVADGTYYPTDIQNNPAGRREDSFVLANGVSLYGGFRGKDGSYAGETSISERQGSASILSGDIDSTGDEDSFNVLTILRVTGSRLDRFTVTGGNADATYSNANGAGAVLVNSNLTIKDCVFAENSTVDNGGCLYLTGSDPNIIACTFSDSVAEYGAAVFNYASSPHFKDCCFNGNESGETGGAVYNQMYSEPTFDNCNFQCNVAFGSPNGAGGAIANETASYPMLANCVLVGNAAVKGGALFGNYRSDMLLVNCTLARNEAQDNAGGLFFDETSAPAVHNSIFWYNKVNGDDTTTAAQIEPIAGAQVLYSCVKALDDPANYNINLEPGFQNYLTTVIVPSHGANESFYLNSNSPLIDQGSNSLLLPYMYRDIAGFKRIQWGNQSETVDMGAYERGDALPPCPFDNVEFDCTYCNLEQPQSYGWQDIQVGCNSMATSFLVENSANCSGTNSLTQSGSCTFIVELFEPTVIHLLVEGTTETQDAGFDFGSIYVNGSKEAEISSTENNGDCQMELHTDSGSLSLEPGEYEIKLQVNTNDELYHQNCYFDFSVWFNQEEPSYDGPVEPDQYSDCGFGMMMMPMAAPSRD